MADAPGMDDRKKTSSERSRFTTFLLVLLALIPGLWIAGALAWSARGPAKAQVQSEEPVVYAAYLAAGGYGPGASVAILDHTRCTFKRCTPGSEFTTANALLRGRLIAVNRTSFAIPSLPASASLHVTMVPDTQKQPVRTFSAVAFNKDLTEALFYTEDLCPLCGRAEFVMMRKQNGVWAIVARKQTWVS